MIIPPVIETENHTKFYESLQRLSAIVGGESIALRLYDKHANELLQPADAVEALTADYLAGKIEVCDPRPLAHDGAK